MYSIAHLSSKPIILLYNYCYTVSKSEFEEMKTINTYNIIMWIDFWLCEYSYTSLNKSGCSVILSLHELLVMHFILWLILQLSIAEEVNHVTVL